MRDHQHRAFTLVEMLVTIAMIAILASLLMPALGRGKESGRVAACQGNLHQIGVALQLYVDDNKNIMPTMYDRPLSGAPTNLPAMNVVLAGPLGSTQVLRCPSDIGPDSYWAAGSGYGRSAGSEAGRFRSSP